MGSELALSAFTAELREAGAPFGTVGFPVTAAVLPAARADDIEQACRTVMEAFDVLAYDVCAGDPAQLGRLCRVPGHELALWDVTPSHDWALIARPDVLLAGDRTAVIEVNAVPQAGQYVLHDMLARAQRQIGGLAGAMDTLGARVPPVTAAFAGLLRQHMTGAGVLALCYWAAEVAQAPLHWYYGCLAHELAAHGIDARICPVEDLAMSAAGVRLAGEPVSAVYRFFEAPPPGAQAAWQLTGRLASLAGQGLVGLVTGFRGEVFASKICLALLSDPGCHQRFPPELAGRLARFLPWTRIVEERRTEYQGDQVDLMVLLRTRRREFVLKSGRGYGGQEVFIGPETPAARWDAALDAAASDQSPWLAQELIMPDVEPVTATDGQGGTRDWQVPVVYGAFMLQRRLLGVLRRYGASPSGSLNINGTSGFVPAPVWWRGEPRSTLPVTRPRPEPGRA
jgi:hypothetical protein